MARGAIAIAAVLLASGTPVLSATLTFDFRAVATTGATAPGTDGAVYQRLEYSGGLDDAGTVAYGAQLSGGTTTAATDFVLIRGTPDTGTVVAREGDVIAGSGGARLGDTGNGMLINNHGTIAFNSDFVGSGVNDDNRWGVVVADAGGLRVAARDGDPVPDRPDAAFDAVAVSDMNDAGTLVLPALLQFPGAYYDNASGLYEEVGGSIAKVVVAGDPAPGTGTTFAGSGQGGSLDERGNLLVSSALSDHTSGVFLRDSSGMTPVARSGGAAPGVPGRTLGQLDGVLGEAGDVVLAATLVDPANGIADGAILYRITQGVWDPLLMTGVAAPDYAGATVSGLGPLHSPNAAGEALIEAYVSYDGFPGSQGHAAYLAGRDGSFSLVLRDFLTMNLDGETRLLSSFSGLGLNDHGQIAFHAFFTDGSDAIVVGTPSPIAPVPLPPALWMALAGLAALGVSARRGAR